MSMGGRAIRGAARYAWCMAPLHLAAASTAYAVLRVNRRKAKGIAAIAAASGHQLRSRPTPNADPDAAKPLVMFLASGRTPYQAAQHLLANAERRNRNTVLCREIVLSASPSYFRPGREHIGGVYEVARLKAWASATLAWVKRTWPDQLASVVLHADEQTPHAHVLVVPRVRTTDGVWKLNSKALFDRDRLRDLQTSYGEALALLGIKRGEPGSDAEHSDVRQFYGAIQQAKVLPRRAVLPPAPKPPMRPSGMAAGADAVSAVLGVQSAYQKNLKAHEAAIKAWRETIRCLRDEDAKAWDRMRAAAAIAPLTNRRQRSTLASPETRVSATVQVKPGRQRAP